MNKIFLILIAGICVVTSPNYGAGFEDQQTEDNNDDRSTQEYQYENYDDKAEDYEYVNEEYSSKAKPMPQKNKTKKRS